jgi:malonyl-CoA/methylmalonyl-CoA synthetase
MPTNIDLAARIVAAANEHRDEPFLSTPDGVRVTYGDLEARTAMLAAGLAACGVSLGDRVVVQVEKSVDAVMLYLACLRMGAVYVPLNTAYTLREMQYFIEDAQPRLVIVRPEDRAAIAAIAAGQAGARVESLGLNGGSLPDLAAAAPATRLPAALDGAALAAIVYTSGTTGRSKGAMLTLANLSSNADVLAQCWRFTRRDVLLHALPLFHIHGLFVALNTVLAAGCSISMLSRFDARLCLEHMPEATVFMGVPTFYTRLLQQAGLDGDATRRMRLFVSGSAPLLAATHHEFARRTGHVILERYGMTETLMNTSNPYDGPRVAGSVGPPLPGVSIRVAGDDIGGLEITGPNVFAGYWRAADKTAAEFTPDGWFKTGDLGRIDSEGYVCIVGRAKDLVISGGYNVYPKEVEAELDALDGVLESAVFGVPHPDFGEGVTAAVVARPGCSLSESQLIDSMQRHLARYKVPKRILIVEELPRNTMGKVQKNELRKTFATLFGNP